MNLRYLLLGLTLGLGACASPSTNYYTLLPPMRHEADAKPLHKVDFQFDLLTVRVPVQVDQPQLVVRQNMSRVEILDNERWSAPLADEFQQALSSQMVHQLGGLDLAGDPNNYNASLISVQVNVRRFETIPGRYALIDVAWSMSRKGDGGNRLKLSCAGVFKREAGLEINSLVLAHQKAIADLAERIANSAIQWVDDPAAFCHH